MNIFSYYSRYQSARGGFSSLPAPARLLLLFLAIPGIILVLLSLLALAVSILTLSLLTVPVYRLLRAVAGQNTQAPQGDVVSTEGEQVTVEPAASANQDSTGRRHIDVKIIE